MDPAQTFVEAKQRRKRAEEYLNSCTMDLKPDAEYKLAEAVADWAGAEVAVVETQLSAAVEGTESHIQLKRKLGNLNRRWEIALENLQIALEGRKGERSTLKRRTRTEADEAGLSTASSSDDQESAQKKQTINSCSASARQYDRATHSGWQWCGDDGVHIDYCEELSKFMDRKLEQTELEFNVTIQGQDYRMDLKRMVQTRVGDEGGSSAKVRKLRRLCKEQELPPTWCTQTEPIETFPVLPHETDFVKAQNILFNSGQNATLKASAFEIVCVRRVQNQLAYERYIVERKNLVILRGAGRVLFVFTLFAETSLHHSGRCTQRGLPGARDPRHQPHRSGAEPQGLRPCGRRQGLLLERLLLCGALHLLAPLRLSIPRRGGAAV